MQTNFRDQIPQLVMGSANTAFDPHSHAMRARSRYEMGYVAADRMRLDAEESDVRYVADLLVSIWREMYGVLTPIIGSKGVTALYQRSLHLTLTEHPWLTAAYEIGQPAEGFSLLKMAVVRQTCGPARAAGAALLKNFTGLLTVLLGAQLTERLVGPVLGKALRAPALQIAQ